MLPHHYEVFKLIQQTYGSACVVSSDKTGDDSPFTFKQKRAIAKVMFGLEDDQFQLVTNPYSIDEYAALFGEGTVVIVVVGEKDMEDEPRFPDTDKPVRKRDGQLAAIQPLAAHQGNLRPVRNHAYTTAAPTVTLPDGKTPASASKFRDAFASAHDMRTAREVFAKHYGKYSEPVFKLMWRKLRNKDKDMKTELTEMRRLAGLPVLTESRYPDSEQGAIDCFVKLSKYSKEHITKTYPDPSEEMVWAIHTNQRSEGPKKHVLWLRDEDFATDDGSGDDSFATESHGSAGSQGYDKSHGSPWDRGNADAHYGRGRRPHYYRSAPGGGSVRVTAEDMTPEEIEAYNAGHNAGYDSYDPENVSESAVRHGRHGGPFDRGQADAHYHRPPRPHYFRGATYSSPAVFEEDMTEAQIAEYYDGYHSYEQPDYGDDTEEDDDQ
jgi:hypothetical protein